VKHIGVVVFQEAEILANNVGTKTDSAYCLSGWCSVSSLQISHGVEATESCNYLASVVVPQLVAARRSCNQQSCRPKYPSRFTRQLQVASDGRRADGGPRLHRFPPLGGRLAVVPPQQLRHRTPPHFLVRLIRTPESPGAETDRRVMHVRIDRGGASLDLDRHVYERRAAGNAC
jgi:hypothetical protein